MHLDSVAELLTVMLYPVEDTQPATLLQLDSADNSFPDLDPQLKNLLLSYQSVFSPPHGLPRP